jgi:hypothetical protein
VSAETPPMLFAGGAVLAFVLAAVNAPSQGQMVCDYFAFIYRYSEYHFASENDVKSAALLLLSNSPERSLEGMQVVLVPSRQRLSVNCGGLGNSAPSAP